MTNSPLSPLDSALTALSAQTWEHLHAAKDLSVSFGEETITDLLTLDIRRQGFLTTNWEQTSKPFEAVFGTDFEWCIGHDTIGWVRFAVQAKKLKLGEQHYNFRHSVHGTTQLAILERYARAVGAIPLYCLYNYSDKATPAMHWQCCNHPFQVEDLGCTVAPSSTIWRLVRGEKNLDFVHSRKGTVPWRCLASCPEMRRLLWQQPAKSSQGVPHESSPLAVYRDEDSQRAYYQRLPAMLRPVGESDGIVDDDYGWYRLEDDSVVMPKRTCILEFSPTDIG